ncbi:TnsD family transposase [Paenibacillus sp. P26]|nr:TnsD family transposase [Paenibacillus sp. P26]UUZ93365.1 TnsD family transposase [Paenibacillus sp. P25]
MVHFFPSPYPEEDYRSIIHRYHLNSSNKNIQRTLKDLFNTNSTYISVLPTSWNRLVERVPVQWRTQVTEIPIKNTLIPLMLPFLDEKKLELLKRTFNGHAGRLGMLSKEFISNTLRYCPKCIDEDYQTIGEVYAHRMHQFPFLKFCYKHFTPLGYHPNKEFLNINDQDELLLYDCPTTEIDMERGFLKDIDVILKREISIDTLLSQFISVLGNKGLISRTGEIYKRDLISDLLDNLPQHLIHKYEFNLFLEKREYFNFLFSKRSMSRLYCIYFFLMRHLCGSADAFLHNDYVYSQEVPLGNGPWKCLNPACSMYNLASIKNIRRKADHQNSAKLQEVINELTCPTCNFSYKINSITPECITITSYGQIWVEKLINLLVQGESKEEIGKSLGVTKVTIYNHIKTISRITGGNIKLATHFKEDIIKEILRFDQNSIDEKIIRRNKYRKEFIKHLNQMPKSSRNEIRLKSPKAYLWLSRHDKEWFDELLPEPIAGNPRLNYSVIDQQIEAHVKEIGAKLRSENVFCIITKTTIISKLEQLERSRVIRNLNRLPKTAAAIQQNIESVDHFAVRCLPNALRILRRKAPQKQLSMDSLKLYVKTYRKISKETEQIILQRIQEYVEDEKAP